MGQEVEQTYNKVPERVIACGSNMIDLMVYLGLEYKIIFGSHTEGEWIHSYADGHRSSESEHRYLLIRVDEKNARLLSTGSCSDIYSEYKNRYISVYKKIPEFYELSRIYGQPENRRLYLDFELERKWAEQYIRN